MKIITLYFEDSVDLSGFPADGEVILTHDTIVVDGKVLLTACQAANLPLAGGTYVLTPVPPEP